LPIKDNYNFVLF